MRYTRKLRNMLKRTRKHMSSGNLRQSYGTVTLPKGFRLYHACINKIYSLPNKPVLFMTLHPSEWYMEDAHIVEIELQREVTLLFMIRNIKHMRIISSLNELLGSPNSNLAKMSYERIKTWLPYFHSESLDGWMSSIENKTTVEFAIVNDPSILKIISCSPIKFNWSNSTYTNNLEIIPKNWGTHYPIYSHTYKIKLNLHARFRSMIESYVGQVNEEDPHGTALSVLLDNASISYFDGPVNLVTLV